MSVNQAKELISQMVREALEEAVYPPNFNVEEFKGLQSFAAKLRYAKQRLPKVASGSARAVFVVDDSTVIKIAMNEKGLAQNKVEQEIGSWGDYPVAKVFDSGDGGAWLEMEKANKATAAAFKKIANISFKEFGKVISRWSQEYEGKQPFINDLTDERYEAITLENTLVIGLVQLLADYDMPWGDVVKMSSWGVVNRKGREELVLIDYGLTKNVWRDYYSQKTIR